MMISKDGQEEGESFTDGRGSICKDLQMIQEKMFWVFLAELKQSEMIT